MFRKKTIAILVVGALAITAGFGAFVYRNAQAAVAQSSGSIIQTNYGIGGGPGRGGATNDNLANALGITTAQLNTAYQKATSDALTQAVSKGLITQAQADQINANGAAFPLDGRWTDYLTQNGIDYNSLLASALGISADKLQSAYIQAYNAGVDSALSAGQITQQQADLMKGQYALSNNNDFQSSMKSAFQAAVQKAVTAGVITQSQADQILQNNNGNGSFGLRGFGGLPGFGGPGRHGGFGEFGGFGNGTQTNPTVPATPSAPAATPQGGA